MVHAVPLPHCRRLGNVSAADIARGVGIAKDAITGIAAGVAAVVAILGLQTWKRQLHGNTNYDVSRRLLRAAYTLRETVRWVRNPMISGGEMAAALKAAGLNDSPPGGIDERGEALAYEARWRKVADAQSEFATVLLEAEALWGPEIRQRGEALGSMTSELYVSLMSWLSRGKRQYDPARENKLMDVIYDAGDGVSPTFSDRLKATFEGLEEVVRPHLKL